MWKECTCWPTFLPPIFFWSWVNVMHTYKYLQFLYCLFENPHTHPIYHCEVHEPQFGNNVTEGGRTVMFGL